MHWRYYFGVSRQPYNRLILTASDLILPGIFFMFGTVFGSFLNVCIYRLPRGLSVVRPRSACPHCRTPVAAWDNIPIFSWLLLGGKCRHCKAPITGRYALVELLTGVLFVVCFVLFGLNLVAIKFCLFSFLILGLIFTDAETRLLPDAMTIPGMIAGFFLSQVIPVNGVVARWTENFTAPLASSVAWRAESLAESLAGAALGAFSLWAVGEVWFRLRGVEGMGFGDVKLMGLIGAFLGVELTMLTIFFGSLAGSIAGISTMLVVWRKRKARYARRFSPAIASKRSVESARLVLRAYEMPFGVFLGLGALLSAFAGRAIVGWYLGMFR